MKRLRAHFGLWLARPWLRAEVDKANFAWKLSEHDPTPLLGYTVEYRERFMFGKFCGLDAVLHMREGDDPHERLAKAVAKHGASSASTKGGSTDA